MWRSSLGEGPQKKLQVHPPFVVRGRPHLLGCLNRTLTFMYPSTQAMPWHLRMILHYAVSAPEHELGGPAENLSMRKKRYTYWMNDPMGFLLETNSSQIGQMNDSEST